MNLYYPLVFLGYLMTLFVPMMRPGIWAAFLILILGAFLVIKKKVNIHSVMDVLIVVYFLYRAASVIWLLKAGNPIGVYLDEFAVSLLPMLFYFVAKACDNADKFYKFFLISLMLLGFISLVLYLWAPQFYCDYLYNWSYISKADAQTTRVRMESVTGCTVFGAVMVSGMAVSIHFLCASSDEKDYKKRRLFGLITFVLSLMFTFLSNMRSAMVAAILLVLYVNYLIFARFKEISRKYIVIEIVSVAVIFLALCIIKFDLVLKIWWRLESLPGAVSQRSEQWVAAVNNMYSSWFGNGLGMNGHKAIGVEGAHVIADGGLIKLFCEEGVIGFSLFAYIMFLTVKKGIQNIKESYAEFILVVMMILQSVGSNIIAFLLITPIFWFCVGRIFEKTSKDEIVCAKEVHK